MRNANYKILPIVGLFSLVLLSFSIFFKPELEAILLQTTSKILSTFGYGYALFGFLVTVGLLGLAISPLGKKRLGNEAPSYSWFSWIAMLYSTGMGAGLLLRAVQEPVFFYTKAPTETDLEPAIYALRYLFFHWGLTPWAMYAIYGLMVSYIVYVRKKNILASSFLPDRMQGGSLSLFMDGLTALITLIGVVASVGLGCGQLMSGVQIIFGLDLPFNWVLVFVFILVLLATISAIAGVQKSIRRLSNLNIILALGLLIFVFSYSPIQEVLIALGYSIFHYAKDFTGMSLNIGENKVSNAFLADWTYFYWAFWLAWAPFTGTFIARISRGRTIRAFIIGTLLIPSIGTFLWFNVFGISAFEYIGEIASYEGQFDDIYASLYLFLETLPLAVITKLIAFCLVASFLLTSIDSSILVLGFYSSGLTTAPVKHKVIWGILIGFVTISLLLIGQEKLLQATSQLLIIFSLPFGLLFSYMLIFAAYTYFKK